MELFSVHKSFNQSNLGEEKHQMLSLNRRLESYLSRVKLLEEENTLLAKEIQALRCNSQNALTFRRSMEEELRHARLEVEAAWRDRVYTEIEIDRLSEQLQALDLQRQREAQAQVEAKTKLEKSKKELEEEQRAQIWLREKISQLEHEMRHLIQTHEEDVAQLEAKMSFSRSSMPLTFVQRGNQMPNLLELGQEFSQQATRAWQEAAEAYEGQLARLEDSLNQTRSRLNQVGQEKRESQLKLQALQKEIASAQDIRMHLEKNVAQQEHRYSKEIQELQGHLEGLEEEKVELGQQIEHILLENRGLLQAKMSLGLEVATYRALLDSESIGGYIVDRNISNTDAVFSPRGVNNYHTQLSSGHKPTSLPSARGIKESGPKVITATPIWRKHITHTVAPKISMKSVSDTAKTQTPYPKILQDGAIENFRPQEVNEKVTYAEPLSPPNEMEALAVTTSAKKEIEENCNQVEEKPFDDSAVTYQVESSLSAEPPSTDEVCWSQFDAPNPTAHDVRNNEEPSSGPDEFHTNVSVDKPENQDIKKSLVPFAAWEEKQCVGRDVEKLQEETSDSETEAVLDPNFESRTSSPASEFEPEESQAEDMLAVENAVEMKKKEEISCSLESTNNRDVEEKLYPDGEEMDTWDSVIEKKAVLKMDDGFKADERLQHAEPEEDISAKEQKPEKKENMLDIEQQDNMEEKDEVEQERGLLSDKEDDEEEDSQNVSVSWRTEMESDSYAQDNTLADTRPLIRYKSDETDGNIHVSHMDESESSDGEQEKKVAESGTGMSGEAKANRFGTMEDLCEEAEGEALDQDFDLGYTQIEDRNVSHEMSVNEDATEMNAAERVKEMTRNVSEGHSDEENEGPTRPMRYTTVGCEEDLDTDRLVEYELENLATESYSAHFAQQQINKSDEIPDGKCKTDEEISTQKDAGETETGVISNAEPEEKVNDELASPTTIRAQPSENLSLLVEMPKSDTDEMVYHEEQEAEDVLKKVEDDAHTGSMWMHADISDPDSMTRPYMKDDIEETKLMLQVEADKDAASLTEMDVVGAVEATIVSQDPPKDVAGCQDIPTVPDTAEWEVLEDPSEGSETQYLNEDNEKCDSVPKSPERQGDAASEEELVEMSPESAPGVKDIFEGKDSAELLNTNGKDEGLHGFFSSGVQNDFWLSSLETGATYQSESTRYEAAEQISEDQGFADNSVWGNVDMPNGANKNSKVNTDSTKALGTKTEQEQIYPEAKKVLDRKTIEGEFVHSEESEVEGESWSSGEEPV